MVSLKVVAATIGAALAPIVVALAAEHLGTTLDINATQAAIASVVSALGAFVAGYEKKERGA